MQWEADAAKAIERAPFFVRKQARRRVEDLVRSAGRQVVTLDDVQRARAGQLANTAAVSQPGAPVADRPAPASPEVEGTAGLSESQIRRIEALAADQDHETRYCSIRGCGGAVGCPLTILDVARMTRSIISTVEASGLADVLATRTKGPVLSHHKFKAAVAGCPNCCSEPQVRDFALVARAWPDAGIGDCSQCGECSQSCRERAIYLGDDGPEFNRNRCVGCGGCAEVCPSEAIAVNRKGWQVMVGGRLGRHPRLALAIADCVDDSTALGILNASLSLLISEGLPGERLGQVLDRVGIAQLGVPLE